MRKAVAKKTGVDAQFQFFVFERSCYYICRKFFDMFDGEVRNYLNSGGSVFTVTKNCRKFYGKSRKRIKFLIKSGMPVLKKTREIYDILALCTSYIWVAHGLEHVYTRILEREVPKYVKGDIGKFIGDISFPSKKNAHALMERALLKNENLESIVKKYGWIRSRDGFADGFTVEEMRKAREEIMKKHEDRKRPRIIIPKPLKKLAGEVREVVYFRTYRTDVLYELLFMCRSILAELAGKYGLTFRDLKNYSLTDLLNGRPKRYPDKVSCACYKGYLAFFDDGPILPEDDVASRLVKGQVAFEGVAKGTAKIVRRVEELAKVREGDILVTQMTFPSFVMAMKRASAFVTDEGGITCHAAIVAREMKKPCIIGTKIATRVFKDGDMVEVDAEKGVVRKI